jgi:hypothetical protein
MMLNMYYDRVGFDFEKVFSHLPDGITIVVDRVSLI